MAIIFDTETTGLNKASVVSVNMQPKIIEFAAIKIDDSTLEEVERLEFFVNPQELITPEITKLTGIRNDQLATAKTFAEHYQELVKFFLGEKYVAAHNVAFDINMLKYELIRINKLTNFPFAPVHICTANQTIKLRGFRLSLTILHEYLFETPIVDAHRAMNDVEALTRIFRELVKRQIIKI